MFSECIATDKNSNASYPIIVDHCPDLAIGAETSLLTGENLQTGIKISYPAFGFVSDDETGDQKMRLKCKVSVKFRYNKNRVIDFYHDSTRTAFCKI